MPDSIYEEFSFAAEVMSADLDTLLTDTKACEIPPAVIDQALTMMDKAVSYSRSDFTRYNPREARGTYTAVVVAANMVDYFGVSKELTYDKLMELSELTCRLALDGPSAVAGREKEYRKLQQFFYNFQLQAEAERHPSCIPEDRH